MKTHQINDLIRNRRSHFPPLYTGERVPDEIVEQMLENANWAPTHRKTEPWRFKVFTGKALHGLKDYMLQHYLENTSTEKQSEKKIQKLKTNPLKASHIVAICMQRDPEETLPEWEEIAAVACAVQNMYLTATAYEVGCYWSSPKNAIEASEFLNLSKRESCLGWFYIGDIPNLNLESVRGNIAEKVEWISEYEDDAIPS